MRSLNSRSTYAYSTLFSRVGGEFGREHYLTLANGGIYLLELPPTIPKEIIDKVEEARQKILKGEIIVKKVEEPPKIS